jgi:hypothetical protein
VIHISSGEFRENLDDFSPTYLLLGSRTEIVECIPSSSNQKLFPSSNYSVRLLEYATSMMAPSATSCQWAAFWILMLLFLATDANAFPTRNNCYFRKAQHSSIATVNTSVHQHFQPDDGSSVTLYLFPTSTAVSRSCWSCSASTVYTSATNDKSVLATSDTLPNFSTAHGLLSLDVVKRIADSNDLEFNAPLNTFLKTYFSRGPMACLSMLSDPNILPELTKAMRAVV